MKTLNIFKVAYIALSLGGTIAGGAVIQAQKDRAPAPPVHLVDVTGKAVSLFDYRGKIVVLNFWATECGGCRLEIPTFIELERIYKDRGVCVVGVSMDISYEDLKNAKEGWARVTPFVKTHGVNYPILMADDRVTKLYDVQSLPATYVIDQRGRIAATYAGVVIDKRDMEANVKRLLAER